ncbi:MAG: two-component system sensor protein [Chthonomonadales bacterium]|nr:two-component system sensor protein [Chthonomonadales bacterium]
MTDILTGATEASQPYTTDTPAEWEFPYRYLFEANPQPMWIYDSETLRFLLVNESAWKHYGYSPDEFLSMTIKDIRPAEDVPLLLKTIMTKVRPHAKRGVWRHRKKDGSIIEVEVTEHDFQLRGKLARLVVLNDVTEHRRIERALLQSEQEQRQLAEHLEKETERLAEAQAIAKVGSWDLNVTTNVLFWSEETYRIFGLDHTRCTASYEAFLERVHPDDRAAVHTACIESMSDHLPYAIDYRMQMEDGSIKIVHERCRTIYDADGRSIHSVGTVQDITQQKQTEQQLTRSLDLLQHIMEGAGCLLWQAEVEEYSETELQWTMQFASEQAAQRFIPLTLTEGMSYGDAWYLSRPSEDRERTDRLGEGEIRAGRNYTQEFRCRSGDGALHWLSENVRVESLGPGRWRCTGVCIDITERKAAEEAARAMTRGVQCLLWYAFVEEQPHGLQWYTETPDEEAAQQFFPLIQDPGVSYTEAWARSRWPADSPLMDAIGNEALLTGQTGYTHQFRCRRADGKWRWLNETVHVEALAPGRWRCVGVCTDVTELKQIREALEAHVIYRTAESNQAASLLEAAP